MAGCRRGTLANVRKSGPVPPGRGRYAGRGPPEGRTYFRHCSDGKDVVSPAPRPHVSAALAHLRFGAALAALTLSIALASQVGVWCFVHFTNVRIVNVIDEDEDRQNFDVVASPTVGSLSGVETDKGDTQNAEPEKNAPGRSLTSNSTGVPKETLSEPVDPNVVSSANDRRLRSASGIVQTVGILSAFMLVVFMLQGVVVAGGGGVPGVEMAVSGATWSLIIGLLATPLSMVIPSAPFTGVFASYDLVVSNSEAYRMHATGAPGPLGFYMMHLVLPFLMMGGVAAAGLRFRAGIEQGVIATSVSEAEERIEREIRARKKLGQTASTRAAGAMEQTINQPYVPTSGATGVPAAPAGTSTGATLPGVHMPVAPQPVAAPPPMQGGRPV